MWLPPNMRSKLTVRALYIGEHPLPRVVGSRRYRSGFCTDALANALALCFQDSIVKITISGGTRKRTGKILVPMPVVTNR